MRQHVWVIHEISVSLFYYAISPDCSDIAYKTVNSVDTLSRAADKSSPNESVA